jgi:hypothetical protein
LDDSHQYVDRSCGQTDPRWIHFQSEKVRPSAILGLRRQKSVNGLVKKMSAAVSTRLLELKKMSQTSRQRKPSRAMSENL